ncbi:MAG: cupin domain-containing protein [Gammaproteobacteria bacterium]|nr:cupin domain-containing protein [Gammaproteobacteria bacterium]NNC97346.1 cupin domain-containing protein [Gammaproteobacteria bacterium]NNM13135.1 cupin domain-containing protein [Gammaproteobacteria bacterium]
MYKILLLLSIFVSANIFAHEPAIVQAGTSEEIPFPGHKSFLLSDSDSTPSNVAILELVLPPKTFGAPPHIHTKEDEHFYVLSGSVEFLNKDEVVSVGEGGLLVLPRGHLHGFWNITNKPAKLLLVVSPGEFASFFDTVVAQIRKENPDDPQKVGQIIGMVAAKYGVTVHPDKIPPSAESVLPK